MKIFDKITNFMYGATHVNQLLVEIDAIKKENNQLKEEREKICAQIGNDLYLSQLENDHLRSDAQKYHAAYKVLCEQGIVPNQAKAIYEAVAPHVDKNGYELFNAAQDVLGTFDFSYFSYEDNRGYFEESGGHFMLRYLLVQYDHKLGKANADKNRWQIACSCYEECVDLSIDETTPEYQEFEKQLYIKVLENLKLLTPAETQAKEVAA